jgi:hypothetical protein
MGHAGGKRLFGVERFLDYEALVTEGLLDSRVVSNVYDRAVRRSPQGTMAYGQRFQLLLVRLPFPDETLRHA